jgi:hypothetical protein
MKNFEKTILFWMRIIALLLWCLLLSYVWKGFGDDAGNALLVTSIVVVAIFHVIKVLGMARSGEDPATNKNNKPNKAEMATPRKPSD